jgi:hypothetical protein
MRTLFILLAFFALADPVRGQTSRNAGVSPPEVAAVLRGAGYPADDSDGRASGPEVRSSTGKIGFSVRFSRCDSELRCATVAFAAAFPRGYVSTATVNAWNRQAQYARAFQDKNGAAELAMEIDTSHGMSADAISASIQDWITALNGFAAFIARQ